MGLLFITRGSGWDRDIVLYGIWNAGLHWLYIYVGFGVREIPTPSIYLNTCLVPSLFARFLPYEEDERKDSESEVESGPSVRVPPGIMAMLAFGPSHGYKDGDRRVRYLRYISI